MRRLRAAILAAMIALTPTVVAVTGDLPGAPVLPAAAAEPTPLARMVPVPPTSVVTNLSVPAAATASAQVTGIGPVPGSATMVSAQLVVTGTADGAVTVTPTGAPATAAVHASHRAGLTTRVAVTVGVGADGRVAVANSGTAPATVSLVVQGYAQPSAQGGSYYVPISSLSVVSGRSVAANAVTTFNPLSSAGVASTGVTAMVLNLAVTSSATGNGTIYPYNGTEPAVPQVEYVAGDIGGNEAIVAPGASGQVTFRNKGTVSVQLTAWLAGYFVSTGNAQAAQIVPTAPQRVATNLVAAAGTNTTVTLAGLAGIPAAGVSAACIHLTVTAATTNGYLGRVRYQAGKASTGSMLRNLTAAGKINLNNSGTAPVTFSLDVSCWFRDPVAPAAPRAVQASGGDTTALVSWSPPSDDGGAPVTRYTVTATPGGQTVTATAGQSTATVTGLTNGQSYWFTVRATNAVGSSDESAPFGPVVPAPPRVPGTPFVTAVHPRDSAVRVSWSPPDTGSADVVNYRVTATPGGASVLVPADRSETIMTGLANGTPYTFTVSAGNPAGRGPESLPSEAVVPSPADAPMEPAALLTVPLDRRIDVQWVAPSDGGAPITGYRVTAEPGGHSMNVAADTTVTALTGLTNGTAYTVRVVALNAAGTSSAAERTGVQPAAARPPAVPTDLRAAVRGTGAVEVRWNAPVDTGTSAVTGYTVTATPGGQTVSVTGTTATVSGLDPAVRYQFTVAARNSAGTGPQSQATRGVVPRLQVKSAPKVLTGPEAAALRQVRTNGSLVFEQPPAAIRALPTGTIVILQTHPLAPNGLFVRVTGVTEETGLVVVLTEPAALNEVFDEVGLAAISEIGDEDVAEFIAESPNIRRKQPTLKGRTLDQGAPAAKPAGVSIGLRSGHIVAEVSVSINNQGADDPLRPPSKTPPVGGRLEAQIDLDPEIHNDVDISLSGVDTFHHASVNYVAEFRAKFGFLGATEVTLPGVKIRARCFNIQAGPVPIVICLDFEVKPTLEITSSMGVTASATFGRVVGAELTTHNGQVTSHQGINQPTNRQASNLEAYADGDIVLALPVETTLYFYNAAGPGLTIRPYVQLKMDTTQNPWWELRVGVTVGVFFKTRKFFGHQIEFTKDQLVNFFVTLASAGSAYQGLKVTPKESTVNPGQVLHLQATPERYPPDIPIHWRMVSGPGQVDSSGNFRSDVSGTAVVEAYSPASAATGNKELTQRASVRVAGATVPGVPRDVVATALPLAAEVSWLTPASDGNLPIQRYAVVSEPASRTVYVDAPAGSVVIDGLTAGVAYTFQVHAVNARGAGKPSTPSDPVVPTEAIRPTGPVVNLAVDAAGNPDNKGDRSGVVVSGDGRYVFMDVMTTSNLMPPEGAEPSGYRDRIVRVDRFTGERVLANGALPGYTVGNVAKPVAASHDGSVVAYLGWPYFDRWDISRSSPDLLTYNINTGVTTAITGKTPQAQKYAIGGGYYPWARMNADGTGFAFAAKPDGGAWHLYHVTGNGDPVQVDDCSIDPGCTDNAGLAYDLTDDGNTIYYTDHDGRSPDPYDECYKVVRYDVATASNTALGKPCTESGWDIPSSVVVAGNGSQLVSSYWHDLSYNQGIAVRRLPTTEFNGYDIRYSEAWSGGDHLAPQRSSSDGRAVLVTETESYSPSSVHLNLYDVGSNSMSRLSSGDLSRTVTSWDMAANHSVAVWVEEQGECSTFTCPGNEAVLARALG